jgi:phage portal protein BeeE
VASIIDRLFPKPEAKAVTGPGAFALANYPPVKHMSPDPNKLMAEAQALFHTNAWVNAAERAIVGRFTRMDWHLEDEDGETVDETSPEPYQAVLRLLERPSRDRTRRKLWGLTLRHQGLAGNGAWLLDQRDGLAGTPLETLYINPARLTPVVDEGMTLLGWVLDAPGNPVSGRQGRPGVPLDKEEVLHFTLDEPDWGIWGIGIAEAAQRKIELDRLTDGHEAGILATGGRLTGLVAPKVGVAVNDDQWKQFVNDYRRITDDPDAAKRLQVAKMPLDFTQMTASPKDLQLTDVARGNRDDILAAWGVPGSQIGVMTSRGLNSGETVKYEEAALWQGAIEPRAEAFRETVQVGLLDRFADLGVKVTLVFDYPEFDDETPLYENASKARTIPLTVNQRLEQVGKDPLDEAIYGQLGQAIFIDQSMVPLFNPEAPEPEPAPIAPAPDEETEVVEDALKARMTPQGLRASTEKTWEPRIRNAMQGVLKQQRDLYASRAEHIARKPRDLSWWNEERENKRLADALEPLVLELASEVATKTASLVKQPAKADTVLERIVDFVRKQVGVRIAGINATTRDKIRDAVVKGVSDGLSPRELGSLIQDSAAFDEYRAEMVSRTETALAYNDSAIGSYRDLGVEQVEVIDGDMDDVCAPVNGATWTMDEARANPIGHPNCTRDFIPVLP